MPEAIDDGVHHPVAELCQLRVIDLHQQLRQDQHQHHVVAQHVHARIIVGDIFFLNESLRIVEHRQ